VQMIAHLRLQPKLESDLDFEAPKALSVCLHRKEVIQPHLPVRLPCYDFVPIIDPTLDSCLPPKWVSLPASGIANFQDVTGGVYKVREHIHRGMLTHDY